MFYLCTDSWVVANVLWGWLDQWKKTSWQYRGKPIWAAEVWQDMAAWVEKLTVKVCHVDAHVPKSWATEEHCSNGQVDQAAKVKLPQVDYFWLGGQLMTPRDLEREATVHMGSRPQSGLNLGDGVHGYPWL